MGSDGQRQFESRRLRERLGNYEAMRRQYDGWIDIKQSIVDQIDRYTTEDVLVFNGGWISVQKYSHSRRVTSIWSTARDCYVFDLALGTRPKSSTIAVVGPGGASGEPVDMGRVVVVPPNQTIRSEGNPSHGRNLRCFLNAGLIEGYLTTRPDWSAGKLGRWCQKPVSGGEIEWCLHRMYREMHEPDFATETMLEMLAKQLAVAVVRLFALPGSDERNHVGGLAPWRMRLIRERVEVDGPAPTLAELAALCDMTVRHLGRAFRAETGQTIGKFIAGKLIERAHEKLISGLPVREVGASLGYATSGSFASAFRRATGLLPSELKGLSRRD